MSQVTPNNPQDDLYRYLNASESLESTRSQIEALEQSDAVNAFHNQMELLKRRLLKEPQAFREMFITDGANAIV